MRAESIIFLLLGLSLCQATPLFAARDKMARLMLTKVQVTDEAEVTTEAAETSTPAIITVKTITPDEFIMGELSQWATNVAEVATALLENGATYETTEMPGGWSVSNYVKLYERLIDLRMYLTTLIESENNGTNAPKID